MRSHITYIAALFFLLITGCIKKEVIESPPDNSKATLRELLANNFSFSLFYEAIKKAKLDTLLDNEASGYTLLAPDNGAFARSGITPDSLRKLLPEELKKLVLYHVIPGKISSEGVPQALNFAFTTLANEAIYTSTTVLDTNLYVNGIQVVKKNISGRNGMIHALKNVLTFPASSVQELLERNPDYSCLTAGLKKFGYWNELKTLKRCVIIAPTNAAFASHNWDVAAIEDMDVRNYKKLVFGSYVLSPAFFFIWDFKMAPAASPFLKEDVLLSFHGASSGNSMQVKVYPINYKDPEYGLRIIFYGDWVDMPYNIPGQLAVNGVVHRVDQLPVIPDSTRIR